MRWLQKVLNFIYYVIIIGCISFVGWSVFDTGKKVYNDFSDQQSQLNELYKNQSHLLNKIYELSSRPSYKYLASVTTFILNQTKGGTGVIVYYEYGYHYILTNKHVCDKFSLDTCTIITYQGVINLEYVKQSESVDLSIWKTNQLSNDYKVVKGFRKTFYGDRVFSVGNYLGYPLIYTEGTLAGYTEEHTLYNLPCAFGCSGSGVFDSQGNLTGLIAKMPVLRIPDTFNIQLDTNKAIAIDYNDIMLFLDKIIN